MESSRKAGRYSPTVGVSDYFFCLERALGGKGKNKSAQTEKDLSFKNIHHEKFTIRG